ncbi:MAG: PLP-dependent aminotransferase family protein [Acidimicrobiales bacterium]
MSFDMLGAFRSDLPASAVPWQDPPDFAFVGGNNDADNVPFSGLAEAAVSVLQREGRALATYNLGGSPQGYLPLRQFVCDKLGVRANTPVQPDEVLVTSGSLQALDLVNAALLSPGDTVIIEQATYGGMVSRLDRLGVKWLGVELDDDGIDVDHLATLLADLAADGVTPKYIYTIPTVQNPTGSVMPTERRLALLSLASQYGVAIFEDDCYADLVWEGERPPSIRALDAGGGHVIYCGSFSKSIAPALRVGYLVADEPVILQLLALKTDAGTGALEQLTLAEYAPTHFDEHVERLMAALKKKCGTMVAAVQREFGSNVEVTSPKGGIYVWLTFPDGVDTGSFVAAAAEAGIQFNPGAGWSADPTWGRRRLRLCFGDADEGAINEGVAALAEVYRNAYS